MTRLFLCLLLCLIPLLHHGQDLVAKPTPIPLAEINDAAAFLAGTELPHEKDHPLTSTNTWKGHSTQMDREFSSHRERVLSPMSEWSGKEIDSHLVSGSTVRYLFSGPDFIHAFHMFPTADTFVMCGLEPVGEIPDLSDLSTATQGRALAEVRNALGEIINFSFFRTKDMKEDLRYATFHGTTPIMMIFLHRSGQYIKDLEFLSLKKDGTLNSQGLNSQGADGVRIDFGPLRVDQTKTIYYFSSDLSNGGFGKTGFETWLESLPKGNAYLKAASFLMHSNWFSEVREHLLAHSFQIVQDDSGIPFRFFPAKSWDALLYGTYTGPIDLFAEYYQADLQTAYRKKVNPLPFGTGYKWRPGQSNLMRMINPSLVPEKKPSLEPAKPAKPESATPSEEKPVEDPAN